MSGVKKNQDKHMMLFSGRAYPEFCLLYTSPSPRDS